MKIKISLLLLLFLWSFQFAQAQKKDFSEFDNDSIPKTNFAVGVEFGYGNFLKQKGDKKPYKGQFELGLMMEFTSMLSKKDPRWRLAYGMHLEGRYIGLKNNQILVDENDVTVLEEFPDKLKKSRFEVVNLLFPVHIEFGNPPITKRYKDDSYYSFNEKLKGGIGGFIGAKIFSSMNYKFDNNGKFDKISRQRSYNTENLLYGISAYIQYDAFRIFSRINLNDMFKQAEVNGQGFVVGVNFIMDK